jgi:hypothetical protein
MAVKIFAGIVMGLVVAVLARIVLELGMGGGERGGYAGLCAAAIGFVATIILALRASASRYAWGQGLLVASLLCLAMPLASMMLVHIVGADQISQSSSAEAVGAAAVAFLAGQIITSATEVIGFFLGAIFLVGSYFALRRAVDT